MVVVDVETDAGAISVTELLLVGLTGATADAEDVAEGEMVTVAVTVAVVVKPELLTDTTVTTEIGELVEVELLDVVDVVTVTICVPTLMQMLPEQA